VGACPNCARVELSVEKRKMMPELWWARQAEIFREMEMER
jgi:hypothetical protein